MLRKSKEGVCEGTIYGYTGFCGGYIAGINSKQA